MSAVGMMHSLDSSNCRKDSLTHRDIVDLLPHMFNHSDLLVACDNGKRKWIPGTVGSITVGPLPPQVRTLRAIADPGMGDPHQDVGRARIGTRDSLIGHGVRSREHYPL